MPAYSVTLHCTATAIKEVVMEIEAETEAEAREIVMSQQIEGDFEKDWYDADWETVSDEVVHIDSVALYTPPVYKPSTPEQRKAILARVNAEMEIDSILSRLMKNGVWDDEDASFKAEKLARIKELQAVIRDALPQEELDAEGQARAEARYTRTQALIDSIFEVAEAL